MPHEGLQGSGVGPAVRGRVGWRLSPLSGADRKTYSRSEDYGVPSRPGEFHPEPLTDPDLNLSIHPARITARRLPPSAEPSGSSRFDPVGPCSTAMTCPLCSTGITPLHHYYGAVRPSPAHRRIGTFGLTVGAACAFPLASPARFSR